LTDVREQALSRRQARRRSRRFATVGVGIPAARLREIAAGAPAAESELTDVGFALAATEIQRQERRAKLARRQRLGLQWLIVAGLFLVLLNLLVCVAYLLFSLLEHAPPF
jgi:hypothetical protein